MKDLRKLFGTDGIRGIANKDLTAELSIKVGRAGAKFLVPDGKRGKIIIGKDTRPSGDFIESALIAGILSSGSDVVKAGIISTPAIALLTKILNLDGGIVISASHNPLDDNGIKFFGKGGQKLTDEQEKAIEGYILDPTFENNLFPLGTGVGRCTSLDNACDIYLDYILKSFDLSLEGLKIAVDCANGSSSPLVPVALERVGAEVISFNTELSGENINKNCGSTYPDTIKRIVIESGVDVGFSYDGDGDRVIACDSEGRILDGDDIMAFCALNMFEKRKLKNNCVVTTIMTNVGFDMALEPRGIKVYRTKVGDRYVLKKMLEIDSVLGGEQSGHIIFRDLSPTGDGLVSTLKFLEVIVDGNYNINDIHRTIKRYPQVLKNIKVKNKNEIMNSEYIRKKISEIEMELKNNGKIVVRPSGTEPVIRIMVEAKTIETARELEEKLSAIIAEYSNRLDSLS